jgi:hypothetical protein
MAQALEVRLNEMVSSANYTQICAKWTVHAGKIISAQLLREEVNGTLIYLVRTTASPGPASFEAKVEVRRKEPNRIFCKIIGKIHRVDSYGEQSFCVGTKTDRDKELKAFCICNSKVIEPKYGF